MTKVEVFTTVDVNVSFMFPIHAHRQGHVFLGQDDTTAQQVYVGQ